MKSKRTISTNPRTLQRLALGAVVLFALVLAYTIHVTNNTVEKAMADHYDPTQSALLQSPHNPEEIPDPSE